MVGVSWNFAINGHATAKPLTSALCKIPLEPNYKAVALCGFFPCIKIKHKKCTCKQVLIFVCISGDGGGRTHVQNGKGRISTSVCVFNFHRSEENSITQNPAYRLYCRKFEENLDALIPHYTHCTCIIVPIQRQVGHIERTTV